MHGSLRKSSPPTDYVRQINTAISWFLWKGAIFRVPLSTLQWQKELGDRALTHITEKCMTFFMLRMKKQGRRIDTFTENWLTKWRLHRRTPNPPLIKGSQRNLTISIDTTSNRHMRRREKILNTRKPIRNDSTQPS